VHVGPEGVEVDLLRNPASSESIFFFSNGITMKAIGLVT
jgi:hypothetical protein